MREFQQAVCQDREGKFKSRTGVLNAEVLFILLNGFFRQADSNACCFPNFSICISMAFQAPL